MNQDNGTSWHTTSQYKLHVWENSRSQLVVRTSPNQSNWRFFDLHYLLKKRMDDYDFLREEQTEILNRCGQAYPQPMKLQNSLISKPPELIN